MCIRDSFGAEVFATVGSEKKRSLLRDLYQIPDDHIFNSRDTSFATGVMGMTWGKGVDIVLNCLAGEKLAASRECIAPYGRFLEIGKKDVDGGGNLAMAPFSSNVSFHCIDMAAIAMERPLWIQKSMKAVMSMIAEGRAHYAQPLHVFGISDLE